jgi:hypothetical protein
METSLKYPQRFPVISRTSKDKNKDKNTKAVLIYVLCRTDVAIRSAKL